MERLPHDRFASFAKLGGVLPGFLRRQMDDAKHHQEQERRAFLSERAYRKGEAPFIILGRPVHRLSVPERKARRVKNRLMAARRAQRLSGGSRGSQTWMATAKASTKARRHGS